MSNPLNNVQLVGRVSQDIKEFKNSDESKTLLVTLAVDDNFVSGKDRKAKTQFVPTRVFIGKNVQGRGSWDRVGKGDLIAVQGRITAEPYVKDGETVYPGATIEIEGFPQFLEPRSVTEARAAKNGVAETTAAPVDESPEATIARLQAELADAKGESVEESTSPFAHAV
jgi:single-stranded DNA-binding protein